MRALLVKIIQYKAEHQRVLGQSGSTLQHVLPQDIVMNNILPFLELPSYNFELEDLGDGENDSVSEHPTMRRECTHMDIFRLRKERKRKNPAGARD